MCTFLAQLRALHVVAPSPICLYYSRLGVRYLENYDEYGPFRLKFRFADCPLRTRTRQPAVRASNSK